MTWQSIDLAGAEYAFRTPAPAHVGLLYAGKRHYLTGPPESLKTLVAAIFALAVIRDFASRGVQVEVAWVDFEMGPHPFRELLHNLGATAHEIGRFMYFQPEGPPTNDDLNRIIEDGSALVVIDAAAGAYEVSGLDDNKRIDAQRFARTWIDPLWRQGLSTLVIDHVVKNSEARGKWAIGSERKIGAVDVHFGLEVVRPLVRGGEGLVSLSVHRDRQGWLQRGQVAELQLDSDPETHAIAYSFQTPTARTGDDWLPTKLMEKVSRWLEEQPPLQSRNKVEKAKLGAADYVRQAMDELVLRGYLNETPGPRGARELTMLKPFREDDFVTSSDFVGTSSDEVTSDFVTSSSAYRRDEDEDEVRGEVTSSNGHQEFFDADSWQAVYDSPAEAAAEL